MDPSYLHYTFIKWIFIERWITPSRKMWNGKEDKTIFHFRFIVPTGKNHSKIQHFRFIDLSSKIHHEWSEWQCMVERYTEETMPPLQYPDCSECTVDFVFPCLSNPCYACGQWFHPACYDDHYCSLSASEDSFSEQ